MDKQKLTRVITARNIIGTIIDEDVEIRYLNRMLLEAWKNLDEILNEVEE